MLYFYAVRILGSYKVTSKFRKSEFWYGYHKPIPVILRAACQVLSIVLLQFCIYLIRNSIGPKMSLPTPLAVAVKIEVNLKTIMTHFSLVVTLLQVCTRDNCFLGNSAVLVLCFDFFTKTRKLKTTAGTKRDSFCVWIFIRKNTVFSV